MNIALNAFSDLGILGSIGKDQDGDVTVYTISSRVLGKTSIQDFFQSPEKRGNTPSPKWIVLGTPFAGGGQGEVSRVISSSTADGLRSNFIQLALEISETFIGKSSFVCAMKRLKKPVSEQAEKRMKHEIESLRDVLHPNLVRIIDGNPAECWFVMEYFPNGTLADKLGYYSRNPLKALIDFSGVVEGVVQLHQKGIIHRDIKPGNIFVRGDGSLVLGDFGLAFNVDSQERLTKIDESTGTDFFMPPWAYGKRLDEINKTFDIYSLGKVLWCMLSGKRKIPSHSYGELPPDSLGQYPAIEKILRKCVSNVEKDVSMDATGLLVEIKNILTNINSKLFSTDLTEMTSKDNPRVLRTPPPSI